MSPSYEENVYFHPEVSGLKKVDELDVGGSYEFDTVLVVRDPEGRLWGAHDSGCSCPTPFEEIAWPGDFTEIRAIADAETLVRELSDYSGTFGERLDFLARIRRHLAEAGA